MTAPKLEIKKPKMGDKAFRSLGTVEQVLKRGAIFPTLIIISAVLFFIMLGLSGLASNPKISFGIFEHSISEVSKLYPLNITPAGWTFSIWGIIYLMQVASALYSLGLLCRQTDKGPAYLNPPVLSPLYFLLFSFSSVFVSGWLFVWDRLLLIASFVFLLCCLVCLWTAFTIASERLHFYRSELIDSERSLDVSVITIAVVNGLGMYATWSVVATLINFGVVFVYRLGQPLEDETASVIALSVLGILVLLYSLLDMVVYEPINRFTFTPYLTIVWALFGILSKNWNAENVSSIMVAILLGCTALLLVLKLIRSISRHLSRENPYRRMNVAVPNN